MAALDHGVFVKRHVVPQVVKAELVVRAVGDVRLIRRLAVLGLDIVDHQPHAQTQIAVELAHPLAVAAGQVIVDGDDVHAPCPSRALR